MISLSPAGHKFIRKEQALIAHITYSKAQAHRIMVEPLSEMGGNGLRKKVKNKERGPPRIFIFIEISLYVMKKIKNLMEVKVENEKIVSNITNIFNVNFNRLFNK